MKLYSSIVGFSFVLAAILAVGIVPCRAEREKNIETHRLNIRINAPADFIYPYLIEEDKIALWNQDKGVEVSFPRGVEPRIGKQIRVSLKVPTRPWMLMEIVKLEPGREVVTDFIDGVLEGSFAYRLESQDDGSTMLVHEIKIQPKGVLIALAWELFGKRLHRRKMEGFLAKIKSVVESSYEPKRTDVPASRP